MADFARIMQPKPYHLAGTNNFFEQDGGVSERATQVVDKLPQDMRDRFRDEMAKYTTWQTVPEYLKQIIQDAEAGKVVSWAISAPTKDQPDSVGVNSDLEPRLDAQKDLGDGGPGSGDGGNKIKAPPAKPGKNPTFGK